MQMTKKERDTVCQAFVQRVDELARQGKSEILVDKNVRINNVTMTPYEIYKCLANHYAPTSYGRTFSINGCDVTFSAEGTQLYCTKKGKPKVTPGVIPPHNRKPCTEEGRKKTRRCTAMRNVFSPYFKKQVARCGKYEKCNGEGR
jgi:hypothetical protein